MLKPTQVADQLQEYSERIRIGSVGRAVRLWRFWRSFNEATNPLRDPSLDYSESSKIINMVASSVLHEIIIIIVRLFDTSGRGNILQSNRVSFPVLVDLMKLDGVQKEVEDRAAMLAPDLASAQENIASVRLAMDDLDDGVHQLLSEDPNRHSQLRAFRNQFLAHNLHFEETPDNPIICHVIDFMIELKRLSDAATIAFGGEAVAWNVIEDTVNRSSDEFWSLLYSAARSSDMQKTAQEPE